jgi:mono/diheme cytochrome c family protein
LSRARAIAAALGLLAAVPAEGRDGVAPGAVERPGGPAAPGAVEHPDGAVLFAGYCAVCHGEDGRGGPGRALFSLPMPDFTDCAFASREPDADWLAVVHEGGPARGFSEVMPAHRGRLTLAEIRAILDHLRTRCDDPRWPRGELNLPRPLVTEKAFPEDEAVVTTFARANRDGDVTTELLFEKRLGPRGQLEISFPLRAREEPGGGWRAGGGDLGLGGKLAVFHDLERGAIAAVGGEILLPTGDEDRGLGRGSVVFEPYVAWGQLLPAGAFVQLQALGEIPTDRDLADELQLRGALGASFTPRPFGRVISPMLEVIGTFAFDGGTTTDVDLVPQVQIPLSRRQHLRLDVGVRLPLTRRGERATSVGVYLLWDWFDGGLLEGW